MRDFRTVIHTWRIHKLLQLFRHPFFPFPLLSLLLKLIVITFGPPKCNNISTIPHWIAKKPQGIGGFDHISSHSNIIFSVTETSF